MSSNDHETLNKIKHKAWDFIQKILTVSRNYLKCGTWCILNHLDADSVTRHCWILLSGDEKTSLIAVMMNGASRLFMEAVVWFWFVYSITFWSDNDLVKHKYPHNICISSYLTILLLKCKYSSSTVQYSTVQYSTVQYSISLSIVRQLLV